MQQKTPADSGAELYLFSRQESKKNHQDFLDRYKDVLGIPDEVDMKVSVLSKLDDESQNVQYHYSKEVKLKGERFGAF